MVSALTFSKVSVLVPTRRRVARLQTLLDSWAATVKNPDQAELVFRIDYDDGESRMFLENYPWRVYIGPRLQGYRSIPQFHEEMRQGATGDIYLIGNDDMAFVTPDWPSKLLEQANQYPDGIFVLGCDVQNAKNFVFPIVSKVAVEAMGRIIDERAFWGDVFLRDVFAEFGRAIRFSSMKIDHQWAGRERDQTFRDANQEDPNNWNEQYWAQHRQWVSESVEKLRPIAIESGS